MGLSAGGLIRGIKKTLVERVGLCASGFDQTIKNIISSQISTYLGYDLRFVVGTIATLQLFTRCLHFYCNVGIFRNRMFTIELE